MVAGVLYDTGVRTIANTILDPGFTPRTGKTQQATTFRTVRTSGGRMLRVENRRDVARFMEEGTRPHVIRAKNARALRFIGRDGNWVFRRRVFHPGTKPYWFIKRAIARSFESAETQLIAGMRRVASV